jgi:uncharacterized SAM-binding protein YcdF (DUF218 family)
MSSQSDDPQNRDSTGLGSATGAVAWTGGRWRRRAIWAMISVALAGVIAATVLSVIIVRYGQVDRARPADVIVVLGGGEAGTERRTRHAVALYQQGYAPVVICTGGGTVDGDLSEAELCAQQAEASGVPAAAIVQDERSRSTEENAIQVARIMRERGWVDAVLVSDNFHLWRAARLFEGQGVVVWPSPAQVTTGPLEPGDNVYSVLRELAAVGWHTGKSLLGLPYTHVGTG